MVGRLQPACTVLQDSSRSPGVTAQTPPISRDHFHSLLAASQNDRLTAAPLLLSLNACMYLRRGGSAGVGRTFNLTQGLVGDREKLGRVCPEFEFCGSAQQMLRRINDGPAVVFGTKGQTDSYLDLKRLFDKALLAAGLTDVMPPRHRPAT
jgi:hypothetical protein